MPAVPVRPRRPTQSHPPFQPVQSQRPGVGEHTVVKTSHDGQDWQAVGQWDAFTRSFTPLAPEALQDYGRWYASKSYSDASTRRRVLWGWVSEEDSAGPARGWQSMNSLPRVLTFNPSTGGIDALPPPELEALRTNDGVPLAAEGYMSLPGDGSLAPLLAGAQPSTGVPLPQRQLEIDAFFSVPSPLPVDGLDFGIAVFVGGTNASVPGRLLQTRVGVRAAPSYGPANNTDEPGGDFRDFASPFASAAPGSAEEAANVNNCSAACAADAHCLAWTYVRPGNDAPPQYPYSPRCSLKASTPRFRWAGTAAVCLAGWLA